MFTGIIKHQAIVHEITKSANDIVVSLAIEPKLNTELGASIACNGICLTVVEINDNILKFNVSKNTMDKTTVNNWQTGQLINIEPSLKLGDELGGHHVTGHIDSTAPIIKIEPIGSSYYVDVEMPKEYLKYFSKGGSIAIDGISLTINNITPNKINLCIIPFTWEATTFKTYQIGNYVNFEVDERAKQIVTFLEQQHKVKE